jgi:lysophospholipase L1-like esterase
VTAVESSRRSRLREAWLALAAVVVSLGLLAIALEAALRLLGVDTPSRRHFDPGIYLPDAELGWVLAPDYRGAHVEYDGPVPTSTFRLGERGWRGPVWDASRRAARQRVLALGDSWTFGRGVPDDATWPARLEAILRARGHDVAVFNAGVPGYDSVQEEIVFAQLADVVAPTLVVLAWLPNDVTERSEHARQGLSVLDGQLVYDVERYRSWKRQVEYGGIYASALYRFLRLRIKRLGGRDRSRWQVSLDDEALAYSQAPLARIAQRAEALGAPLLVVLAPREEEVAGTSPIDHHRRMAEFVRARGAGLLDLASAWRAGGVREGRFLPRDAVHLTVSGCDEVARALAAHPWLAARTAPAATR